MGAIGDQLRADWTYDSGALDAEKRVVILKLKVDAGGIVTQSATDDDTLTETLTVPCATLP